MFKSDFKICFYITPACLPIFRLYLPITIIHINQIMANQNRRELLMIQPVGKVLVNSFIFYAQLNYDDVYMSIRNKGVDSRDRVASFKYSIKTVYIFSQAIRKTLFTFIKISFRRYFLRS